MANSLTTGHNLWQQAVKHEMRDLYNYNDQHLQVYDMNKITENLNNLQTIKMKNQFYAKHLNRYMGDTIPLSKEQLPRFSIKKSNGGHRNTNNKSMQRMNDFSPIQSTKFVQNSPFRGAVIHMERPIDIRRAAAEEVSDNDLQFRLKKIQSHKSRTNNNVSRETAESSIFSKIAKRTLQTKEKTKLMYSCPDGITKDSIPRLQGYNNILIPKGEQNPYSDTSSFLPQISKGSTIDEDRRSRKLLQKIELIKIQRAIEEEKKRKAEIKLEILSIMESHKELEIDKDVIKAKLNS